MSALAEPALKRLRQRTRGISALSIVSAAILVIFVVLALASSWIVPYDPTAGDFAAILQDPSAEHWLGTDQQGKDVLSMLIGGAWTSLLGPLGVVVVSTVLGFVVGMVAGWRGGWVDSVLSRGMDILFAFPALLLAILAVSLFGKGLTAATVAMSIAYLPYTARLVRGVVLQERARPYVLAYKGLGLSDTFIAVRRVLPNIAPLVLAQSAINFGYALLDLAAISFLGLGVQPPEPDWGAMINGGQSALLAGAPYAALAPAVAIVIVVIAFNEVGEELADRIQGIS